MNQDEIEKMLNVAAQSWQDRDKFEIEGYIAGIKQNAIHNIRANLATEAVIQPEPTRLHIEAWAVQNRSRVAQQIGTVIEMMLRKELLGE